jgi:hypothetical protein
MDRRYRDARHLVAVRRPATGEDPAAAGGGAVIAQLRKRAELLAFLDDHRPGCRVGNIRSALPLLSIATSSDAGSCGVA